jgi:hypothetical protein
MLQRLRGLVVSRWLWGGARVGSGGGWLIWCWCGGWLVCTGGAAWAPDVGGAAAAVVATSRGRLGAGVGGRGRWVVDDDGGGGWEVAAWDAAVGASWVDDVAGGGWVWVWCLAVWVAAVVAAVVASWVAAIATSWVAVRWG